MTREQFEALILRFFGLTEALRSDQSHQALQSELQQGLMAWPSKPSQDMSVYWTFADRLIAYAWGGGDGRKVWEIPWQRAEDGITFGEPVEVKEVALFEPVTESRKEGGKSQRLNETIDAALTVTEAQGSGARRVKAVGITADVVNGNRRRYPRAVLANAVAGLNEHLHESAGQGRLIATGEVEHPSDKGGRPNLLETVIKWEAASLDSSGKVLLEGAILPTAKGKDIQALVEGGIPVGVSMRGYGSSELVQEAGQTIQQVTELTITGFDLVSQPSDPNGRLTESQQEKKTVTLEELLKLLAEKPELREALLNKLGLAEKAALAESLGVKPEKLEEALGQLTAAQAELSERKHREAIDAAIAEACKDLAYGPDINAQFVESVRQAAPADAAAVPALVAAKRKEYDSLMAQAALGKMGKPNGGVQVLGPVFEAQTGQPEFTAAAYQFTERLAERGYAQQRDLRQATKPSELFARRYLEYYDQAHKRQLIAEAQRLQEAETTADLALPYSFGRAIVAEVVPQLVALSVFDSGFADSSPSRVYYENYTPETGAQPSVVDEAVTADLGEWVNLGNARIRPGTVVVTNSGATVTYTEYTDYLIDYANGRLYTVATITDGQSLKVDYTYDLTRGGEMSPIQRGKGQLSFKTIELEADRLAQQISDEAVTFARTQIGWDATARTMAMIIREIREMIDTGIIRLALAQVHISGNSGGSWNSSSDTVDVLVQKLGVAKVAVQKDLYSPSAILMSLTNADRLSNWSAFAVAQNRPDASQAPGTLGYGDTGIRVKGLPVFASDVMPDSKILVTHRELVQYRVLSSKPLTVHGPYQSYHTDGKLIAAAQYYCEEYNATLSLIADKGGYVTVS
jgi:hypothetical protein